MRLTRKKIGNALAGVALVAALALSALAQQGPDGPRGGSGAHGRGHRGDRIPFARDIDLTDQQKAQIEQLQQAFRESTRGLHDQLRAVKGGGADPLSGGAFDEAAVRRAAQERAALHVELEVAHARLMSQIAALLTPEQKAKIAERRQQFEQRRRGRGGPGFGGPGDEQ